MLHEWNWELQRWHLKSSLWSLLRAAAFYLHIAWASEAPKTSTSQDVFTDKAVCLSSNLRKDGGVKLAREFIDKIYKNICKEIFTVEREMDTITAEHLMG